MKKKKLKKIGRSVVQQLANTSLPEVLFISSLIIQRWWLNSDISYPADIVPLLVLFAILATATFYIYKFVLKHTLPARLASIMMIYFGLYLYSFTSDVKLVKFIVGLLPNRIETVFTKSVFLAILLAVFFGAIGFGVQWLLNKFKTLRYLQLGRITLFAILFSATIIGLRAGSRLISIHSQLAYQYPAPTIQKKTGATTVASKPNIYFLMYEDYTDATTLKRVNNYDNSPFFDSLDSLGFTTHRTGAYSSYPFTTPSLSSTFAMNYFPGLGQKFGNSGNWQTAFPYRSIINNPPAVQLLKQNGYSYNQVSSWWENTRVNIKADNQPTRGYRLTIFGWHSYFSDLARDILNKSIFSPWLKKGISIGHFSIIKYDLDYNPQENLAAETSALKAIADQNSKAGSPQFTYAQVMVPHTPYIFLADGTNAAYSGEHDDDGASESDKYANQVEYINNNIQDLTSYIRKKDPSAVIILQSDEGSYPPQFRFVQTAGHYYNAADLSATDAQQKFGILASYYMPGIDADTVNTQLDAAVNVFPFVLNHYLGYDIPLLPNCQIANGNKYGVFKYTNVTGKTQGQSASSDCQRYQ